MNKFIETKKQILAHTIISGEPVVVASQDTNSIFFDFESLDYVAHAVWVAAENHRNDEWLKSFV